VTGVESLYQTTQDIVRLQRAKLPQVRTDLPNIPPPAAEVQATDTFREPNPIQKSLVSAYAVQQGKDPGATLSAIKTRQDAINYFQSNPRVTRPPTGD